MRWAKAEWKIEFDRSRQNWQPRQKWGKFVLAQVVRIYNTSTIKKVVLYLAESHVRSLLVSYIEA